MESPFYLDHVIRYYLLQVDSGAALVVVWACTRKPSVRLKAPLIKSNTLDQVMSPSWRSWQVSGMERDELRYAILLTTQCMMVIIDEHNGLVMSWPGLPSTTSGQRRTVCYWCYSNSIIGIWNIRTLKATGKLEELENDIIDEMLL